MSSSSPELKVLSTVTVTKEGGILKRITHSSSSTQCEMTFGIFLPSTYDANKNLLPVLYWLSGLTCNDTNFEMKAGPKAFSAAEKYGLAIVMPDTSPRGDDVPDKPDCYYLGKGAGLYVDAIKEPYDKHFKMYTYITEELPTLISKEFSGTSQNLKSIFGHSMGGHGALTIALKANAGSWKSVSAFAPICNPTLSPWGKAAFDLYGVDGTQHDATILLSSSSKELAKYDDILIDQGDADEFLENQLMPQKLLDVVSSQKITLNMRKGFDHSYYFIAAFVEDHIEFHAKRLLLEGAN